MIEAGSDLLLRPSLYESCGLNQTYSLCYGTLPLVRSAGGSKDTVIQNGKNHEDEKGFIFDQLDSDAVSDAVGLA